MKRAVAREADMPLEERVAKIESDVGHILSDVGDLKNETRSLRGEVQELRSESESFRTYVVREFGLVRAEAQKESGLLRTEIAKIHTAIERSKVWFLATIGGAVISIVGALVGLHALKLF
jgi:regulator of replication initiation timing